MDKQQEVDNFNDFVTRFYGYGKLISAYSSAGNDLLTRINEKSEDFNKLSENKRIEMMNNDPDFQNFQIAVGKLYSAYAQFILLMDEGFKISSENQNTSETTSKSSD